MHLCIPSAKLPEPIMMKGVAPGPGDVKEVLVDSGAIQLGAGDN